LLEVGERLLEVKKKLAQGIRQRLKSSKRKSLVRPSILVIDWGVGVTMLTTKMIAFCA